MGKWEIGYHQANRALQSANQIRKRCVVGCSCSVCTCVLNVGGGANGKDVLGVQCFKNHWGHGGPLPSVCTSARA